MNAAIIYGLGVFSGISVVIVMACLAAAKHADQLMADIEAADRLPARNDQAVTR